MYLKFFNKYLAGGILSHENVFGANRLQALNLPHTSVQVFVNLKIMHSKSTPCVFVKNLLAILLLSFAFACNKNKEEIIQQKVTDAVSDFRQKKMAECREILLREAEETVDSLLLLDATNSMNDSLARLRPFRPVQPPPILPIDSLQVQPIFPVDSGKKG